MVSGKVISFCQEIFLFNGVCYRKSRIVLVNGSGNGRHLLPGCLIFDSGLIMEQDLSEKQRGGITRMLSLEGATGSAEEEAIEKKG